MDIAAICDQLKAGKIIAYPTEAVFGLGCDPNNDTAIQMLLNLKQRPAHKGLIIVASEFSQLTPFIADIPEDRLNIVLASWPGPSTWIFPVNPNTSRLITGNHDSIAVRVSAHPVVQAICQAFGPIISTSANLATQPPAITTEQAHEIFQKRGYVVDGKVGKNQKPTSIRNALTGTIIRA